MVRGYFYYDGASSKVREIPNSVAGPRQIALQMTYLSHSWVGAPGPFFIRYWLRSQDIKQIMFHIRKAG
jgi:hypothetical protein